MHAKRAEAWPIFVISLQDAHERRRSIREQCTKFALEFEFFDAIDGRTGLAPEFEVEIDREAARANIGRFLTDAEFGCALSHRRIYQLILQHGLPGAVVLEDDAVLGPEFRDFIIGRGYMSADFIQMGYHPVRIFRYRTRRWSREIRIAELAELTWSTIAYSISARGAEYILSHSPRLAGVADWPVDLLPLRPCVTLPAIVTHPLSSPDSSIEVERAPRQAMAVGQEAEQPSQFQPRWARFGRTDYWQRWWFKRRSRNTPGFGEL